MTSNGKQRLIYEGLTKVQIETTDKLVYLIRKMSGISEEHKKFSGRTGGCTLRNTTICSR